MKAVCFVQFFRKANLQIFSEHHRRSHQRCSIKNGVLKSIAIFTEKHLCQSLFFNKVEGLRPETLLKKSLWHRCFPMNFAKFLRTPFSQNTFGWLLLTTASFRGVCRTLSNFYDGTFLQKKLTTFNC